MSETATIVTSIIGTGAAIVAITAAMLRILSTNLATQFAAVNKRIDDTNQRIDDTRQQVRDGNLRTETLATEMHQRFDQVHRDLAENRERMAKLEGALEGFIAGQRNRTAA